MMSNSWQKFGEVYKNLREECVFVCLVCMQRETHINLTYSTSDASAFSKHIQQHHISRDCEFMEEPPAKKRQQELQQQRCDISRTNDSSIVKTADSADSDTVHTVQNKIQLLEMFHESLVDNFGKSEEVENKSEDKEPQQLDVKVEVEQTQLQDMIIESEPALKVEPVDDSFIQSNLEETKRNSNMLDNSKDAKIQNNAYSFNYTHNQEIYEISDDDGEDEDGEEDGKNGNLAIKDQSAKNYLANNLMIELSDEEDEINTLPNSPQLNMEQKKKSEEKQVEKVNSGNSCNSGYNYNCLRCHIRFSNRNELIEHLETHEIEASALSTSNAMNRLNSIPTPEASPNDMVLNQNLDKNVQPYQCHYCPQRFFQVWQLDRHQRLHLSNLEGKRKFKSRPFQCNVCGKRTTTEKAMLIHQRRFHSSESDLETSHCQLCQKRILTTNLQQHMLVHSELRYKCNHCDQTYKQKQTLRKHVNKFHPYATMDLNPLMQIPPRLNPSSINTSEVARETHPVHQERSPLPLDSQSRLTPEEQELMFSVFLHCHSQNQNKEQTTTSATSNGSMDG